MPQRSRDSFSTRWLRPALLLGNVALTACSGPGPRVNNVVPIVLTTTPEAGSDEIGGMIVPVVSDGNTASLAIDTGSSLTFLYTGRDSAPYTPSAGRVTIGHESFDLPGRNFEAEDETGAHIVGVLGAEFLLDATTEFDPRRMTITRYKSGSVPDTRGWVHVPMEDVDGHIILTLTIDGRDRRLMWDTGSPHLLLIGVGARPGDTESVAQDVAGGLFPVFSGFAALQVAGAPERQVRALRAPRFPYFEGTVEALGGNIDGLAGQSVFGHRRLIFCRDAGMLFVAPDEP